MPTGHNQQRKNTNCHGDKISRHALGPQAKLGGPHCQEEEANRAQIKRIILATWKEVASIENKLLIHKTTIKPIWTYGIEIWGCASKSSQAILQKAQSKILRMITNAPLGMCLT
jgi:hypothetical protein